MSLIFTILLALVALSPLPFGARQPWAWSLMAMIVALLMTGWTFRTLFSGKRAPVGLDRTWPVIAPFLLVILWIAVQASGITPDGWHHPLWREAGRALGGGTAGSVSLNPSAGYDGMVRLLAFGGIFWLALQYGRESGLAYRVLTVTALAGLVYAAYGLTAQFLDGSRILWFDKKYYVGSVTGTMEYKNAFATYAALGLICSLGILMRLLVQASSDSLGPRDRMRRIASRVLEHGWIYALAAFLLVSALLLANSRGGMLAAMAGVGMLIASYGFVSRARAPVVKAAGGLVVLAGTILVAFSGAGNIERIDRIDPEHDTRTLIYERTITAIGDSPILGTGYRTFPQAFAMYNTRRIGGNVHRAHNSYLDNALGLGVPGAALLVISVAAMATMCLRGLFRRQRDVIFPCVGLAATAIVGVHALFDFTLQVPAVMATYLLIMGVTCAQSWSTRTG